MSALFSRSVRLPLSLQEVARLLVEEMGGWLNTNEDVGEALATLEVMLPHSFPQTLTPVRQGEQLGERLTSSAGKEKTLFIQSWTRIFGKDFALAHTHTHTHCCCCCSGCAASS